MNEKAVKFRIETKITNMDYYFNYAKSNDSESTPIEFNTFDEAVEWLATGVDKTYPYVLRIVAVVPVTYPFHAKVN